MKSNRIPVEINGMGFTVIGEGKENYIKMIAHLVEQQLNKVKEKNPQLSGLQALTLAAFNLADEGYRNQGEGTETGKAAIESHWMDMTNGLKKDINELKDGIATKDRKIREQNVELDSLKERLKSLEQLDTVKKRNEQLLNRQIEDQLEYRRLKQEHEALKEAYEALTDGE
ncbi:MAG: cell division protein ZapA [Tissierellia bacterium]|nr:cell division protein ZapA [Tissierellia bacterium]